MAFSVYFVLVLMGFILICDYIVVLLNGSVQYSFSCYIQVAGNENPSILICFASKTMNAGQITSKLHVIELGAQPGTTLLH